MSICTPELQILNDQNVMGSQTGPDFQRTQTIFQFCQNILNPFTTFCLYPPNQDHMPVMCRGDPSLFFFGMLDSQMTKIAQLPRVISYPNLHSDQFFVQTTAWLGTALAHVPDLQAFATSNNASVNLAILSQTVANPVLLQNADGLMRQQTQPTGLNNAFATCVVNGDGSVQGVMFSNTGGFVSTTASNGVFESLFLPANVIRTNLVHVQLLIWEDNTGSTFLALASQASPTGSNVVYVHQYQIDGSVPNPGSIVPYKQTILTLTSLSNIAWVLLSTEDTQICFGVANITSSTYSVFRVTTANDSQPLVGVCTVSLPFTVIGVVKKWYGFLPPTLQAGNAQLLTEDRLALTFTFPATNITVPGVQTFTPNVTRLVQRRDIQASASGTEFFLNGTSIPTPFTVNQALDVYAITMDGKEVNVIAQDGHYYQLNVNSLLWTTSASLDLFYANGPMRLDELQDPLFNQWFLGISQSPQILPFDPNATPLDIFVSRHMIFKVRALSVDPLTRRLVAGIFEINLFQMVTSRTVITQLYDNGVVKALDAFTQDVLWESDTNDQEGSDMAFNVLSLETTFTTQASFAVSSPNGRYMLCVLEESVDLVFNPFNLPRFTKYVEDNSTVDTAANAQSNFCFQALNNTKANALKFVDNHCACLSSTRLASRVYPQLSSLPIPTQIFLTQQTPCVLQDCQVLPTDEYTISNMAVGTRCINDVGICSQFASPGTENILLTQDCGLNLRTCVNSADCPLGANCRNGQCVEMCSSDITCINANPLARCVNGQCQVQSTSKNGLSLVAILSIIFGALLLLLLLFVVYFAVRRTEKARSSV